MGFGQCGKRQDNRRPNAPSFVLLLTRVGTSHRRTRLSRHRRAHFSNTPSCAYVRLVARTHARTQAGRQAGRQAGTLLLRQVPQKPWVNGSACLVPGVTKNCDSVAGGAVTAGVVAPPALPLLLLVPFTDAATPPKDPIAPEMSTDTAAAGRAHGKVVDSAAHVAATAATTIETRSGRRWCAPPATGPLSVVPPACSCVDVLFVIGNGRALPRRAATVWTLTARLMNSTHVTVARNRIASMSWRKDTEGEDEQRGDV